AGSSGTPDTTSVAAQRVVPHVRVAAVICFPGLGVGLCPNVGGFEFFALLQMILRWPKFRVRLPHPAIGTNQLDDIDLLSVAVFDCAGFLDESGAIAHLHVPWIRVLLLCVMA